MLKPQEINLVKLEDAENEMIGVKTMSDLPMVTDTLLGPQNAKIGILLIHGFAGSNLELLYLGNFLANQGYRVLIPVLPGHGLNSEELLKTDHENWKLKTMEAYQYLTSELDRSIIVIGHSMGGALSLLLGSQVRVSGIISIAGPVRFPLYLRILVKLARRIRYKLFFEKFYFHDDRLYDHPGVTRFTENYGRIGIKSVSDLFNLLDEVYHVLPAITVPVCLVYAKTDHLVPSSQVEVIRNNIGSIDLEEHWLSRTDHILVIDTDKDLICRKIQSFITRIVSTTIS